MNLGLHGLLLQVIVTIVQFQHGFRLCCAGEPGYLDFDNLPETNFSCQGKVIGGYYADVEAGCQMFHVCTIGQKDEIMDIKFLCLNGTVFDQETRVCERVDEVDCSKSEKFYNLNLELYGNHAVTLSLHETGTDEEDDPSDLIEEHESQRTTSARPSTTSSTTTTTPRPSISSTTSASGSYQHPSGYPQHYQPQPRFPSVQTSQSKSLYDDKNGGYHHQYIYHTGDHRTNNLDNNNNGNNNNNENNNNNQATSYQLFSNHGVSSTTGVPQIHQIRYSSTPSTQIQIRNDHQPTVSPIFHATSSTIQTLLNSNANSPALINPIFHNHGIASTTEQFTVHNNNPRETNEYRDNDQGDDRDDNHEDRRPLEAIQPTTQGKVSKLTISPIPTQEESNRANQQGKNGQQQQQQRINGFLPSASSEDDQAVRSFYPTPRTSTKSSSSHVTHIHLPPPPAIPQLKPHQITINLQSPDIQRIVQNPSPLLPSQSRVIVTAKASVSDESGRSLNTTQLVTLPLPTIPASYDDYKEGDESFDPFYRDVPKIRNDRRAGGRFRWPIRNSRDERSLRIKRDAGNGDDIEDIKVIETSELTAEKRSEEMAMEKVDDIEDKKLETENDRLKNVDVIRDEGLLSENEKPEEMVNIEDKKSEIVDENQKYMDDSKILTSRNQTDFVEKVDENSGSENNGTNVENEEQKDTDDLKTMSSRHHLDSDEKVDKKSSIKTKESDEDDYVDDAKRKSVIDSREIDAEEYVNSSDEEFDSTIFDEPESQTSKDVDTRAVEQQNSKYSNDEAERYDNVEKKSKHDHSNGLGVTKREPEEESSRFSLLPEVVSSRKSHRNHSAKKIRERVSSEEDEDEEEEVYKSRKSHRKHSARKSKHRERVLPEEDEEEEEEDDDEKYREEVLKPRKSHRKHSARKSKPKERILRHEVEDEDEEQDDEEQDREEIYRPRKNHRKNSAKKSKLRERLPAVEEEEENEEDEEVGTSEENFRPRKTHRKHSAKKSKLRERLPPVEEEEEEEERSEEILKPRTSRRKNSTKKSKLRERIPIEEADEEEEEEEEETKKTRELSENYDYYDAEVDSSSVRSNEEYSTEYSKELQNKIHPSSRPDKSSRHGKTFEYSDETSHEKSSKRRDESRKFEEEDDYDFSDVPTTLSNEEITSTEVSDEYVGSRINANPEDSRELQNDERETPHEDKTQESNSDLSGETTSSTEKFESPKDATTHDEKDSRPTDEGMSEGVLKFTDEIPSSEKAEEPSQVEDSKSVEETAQDYIDDNYEPQSYKEHNESLPTTEAAITEKSVEKETSTMQTEDKKNMEEISMATTGSTSTTEKEEITKIQNDQAQLNSSDIEVNMEKSIEKPLEIKEITSSTSTTSTTSTTTTTTTTAKPTSPKLFKPFTLRKNYVYIPPTTTPVPVIIKQRLPLLNPKPAKPPKSYNELAPKPVIRKTPLFARKTILRATTPYKEIENRETSTELAIGTTDSWMTEEIISSTSTTPLPTTGIPPSSSQVSIALPITNEDEKLSRDEDHISSPTTDNFDLLPNHEIQTFTPYPLLLKLSEATASMQGNLPREEEDISTTENNNVPSLSEPEMTTITTTEASTTSVPEKTNFSEEPQTTEWPAIENMNPPSLLQENVMTNKPDLEIVYYTTIKAMASEVVTENPEITTVLKEAITNNEPTVASVKAVARRPGAVKRTAFFNCLDKEMYRFYADGRDCRLFHYCSPGFTSRQVLDFRFVCEEGTAFDEESQSCMHDVKSSKCLKRVW